MTQYYLKLDQDVWGYGDYTDSNSYALTGTIYTDEDQTVAANLTGFTLTIKFYEIPSGFTGVSDTAEIITAGSGTWRYKPSSGKMPARGLWTVVMELSLSGSLVQTINRQELLIR